MNQDTSDFDAYMKVASEFKLGALETESQHPLSKNLSDLSVNELGAAIDVLKKIDLQAFGILQERVALLDGLAIAIRETLESEHKIYLCGCGATGRLSLSLEVICREGLLPNEESDRVVGFMAGGDTALIRSIENFEDYPAYGKRQLEELGFQEGDLLISTTEGGETSFVIGATEYAAKASSKKPWFLYCNPDAQLTEIVERSRRVIENSSIEKINLSVGPMAIAGSTRMQSSTVLMTAVGLAFMCRNCPEEISRKLKDLIKWVENADFNFLSDFIVKEHDIYSEEEFLLYKTNNFGITVLTDTTERCPTFSLPPFENYLNKAEACCLCYLYIDGAKTPKDAWLKLLKREPRCLEWSEYKSFAGIDNFYGYNISEEALCLRAKRTAQEASHVFEIMQGEEEISFKLGDLNYDLPHDQQSGLFQHVLLKLLLNIHSTLLMGRMGRYSGNLMTYVKPSNYKLIDRSIRYVQILYKEETGQQLDYEKVARQLFQDKVGHQLDEPIVLKVLDSLLNEKSSQRQAGQVPN